MSITTAAYRQEVANYLFSCDQKLSSSSCRSSITSWIGDAARTVTLRSVAAAAEGDPGAHDISAKTSVSLNRADYVCMTCGTFLLPQAGSNSNYTASSLTKLATNPTTTTNCKISLQSMKRGRSRRRRASRCRAKELHNSSLLMKRAGSTNNAQVRANVMAQKELLKVADSYRLGDGKSKQCIVVECKFCGSKRKRKGMEVSVKSTRRKTEQSDAKASRPKSKREKETQAHHAHAQSTKRNINTIGTQIQDNSDFISLASFGKSKQQATKKRPVKNATPLLQGGKKKKKKQEPKSKKSGLMDFLSSLND